MLYLQKKKMLRKLLQNNGYDGGGLIDLRRIVYRVKISLPKWANGKFVIVPLANVTKLLSIKLHQRERNDSHANLH